jgi:hypothetical protein
MPFAPGYRHDPRLHFARLEYNRYRKPHARVALVVKVVSIVIDDIDVVGSVPVLRPILWPRIDDHKRLAAVREARVSHVDHGFAAHPEPVVAPEVEIEAGLRNVVTAIASTLRPGAMVALPVLSAISLPGVVPLPAAAVLPSCLRLPRSRLLLRALRLLLLAGLLDRFLLLLLLPSLLDRFLLPRLLPGLLGCLVLRLLMSLLSCLVLRLLMSLLSSLVLRLLLPGLLGRLPLRDLLMSLLDLRFRRLSALCVLWGLRPLWWLLCARLWLLWLCLGARLWLRACRRCSCACRRGLLRPALLLFRLALLLLLVLCVRRHNHHEKQKHGRGAGSSNELHDSHPQISSLSVVHLEHQSAWGRESSTAFLLPGYVSNVFLLGFDRHAIAICHQGRPFRRFVRGAVIGSGLRRG